MSYRVLLTASAQRDIKDIYHYIAQKDSIASADRVFDALDAACEGLAHMPQRGNFPKELVVLGISEYREAHDKAYRIIYRILENAVLVYCVVDGRRDMQSFLERRLLR